MKRGICRRNYGLAVTSHNFPALQKAPVGQHHPVIGLHPDHSLKKSVYMNRTIQQVTTLLIAALCFSTIVTQAQPISKASTDSARVWIQQHSTPVSTNSYKPFIKQLSSALHVMETKQVVGLGEGTHGTSEFQTVRAYITRYLCTEKGFRVVCLENSYGWCVELNNYVQTGQGNLDTLMKKNLLGMWQNAEIRSLLEWMKQYNHSHKAKLQLAGMDYSETSTSARIIQSFVQKINNTALSVMTDSLLTRAAYMDAAYSDFNNAKSTYAWKDVLDNGVKAYELNLRIKKTLDSLKQEVTTRLSADEVKSLYTALYNTELAYYSIYKPVKENVDASRDEIMANMVKRIKEDNGGAKTIVWAHNAHMAKGKVFEEDNNGGGTGSFLESYYPGAYYVLGTGTLGGTFSATSDRFILSTSAFKSYPLNKADANSWEEVISSTGTGSVFINAQDEQYPLPALPLRFTGYGHTQKGAFVNSRLNKLFDGFLFIPATQATHIQQ
jgi:erythromycin esterase